MNKEEQASYDITYTYDISKTSQPKPTDEEIAREAAITIVNESSCISDELGGIQDIIISAIKKAKE